jgi:hypothetical protein
VDKVALTRGINLTMHSEETEEELETQVGAVVSLAHKKV